MLQMIRVLLVLGLIAGSVFNAAPAASASSSGCDGFNGHWLTSWPGGTVKMQIAGTKGLYEYKGGILTGSLSGREFSGTYAENDGGTGTFTFKLDPGSNSFSGWYASAAHPDRHSVWTGVCTGP
jgi:hypothetical protein